ncbi:hypothetical protein BO78DRAFT_428144 [Aspergillus sclerotiicarbonarius CBS 121057]|uniref:BZIP domain-containing protein n=1 Tax=Aspergillus sclerotiicarbonarius (strain CBS 121057 / IBT 28362) TaxID=1448318 RepID=A0A319EG99_ASPSB|nr:hypothetical protein BO78DRAFT_428144 [Aspergillus sclerotiicarbonarius CBS 121057]
MPARDDDDAVLAAQDYEQRRKIQNRLAQRRFREKARQQRELNRLGSQERVECCPPLEKLRQHDFLQPSSSPSAEVAANSPSPPSFSYQQHTLPPGYLTGMENVPISLASQIPHFPTTSSAGTSPIPNLALPHTTSNPWISSPLPSETSAIGIIQTQAAVLILEAQQNIRQVVVLYDMGVALGMIPSTPRLRRLLVMAQENSHLLGGG